MIAYAYVETYSRTLYSDKPVQYFVLRYGLFGGRAITTTNPEEFLRLLNEEVMKRTRIVRSRLPFGKKSIDEVAVSEDGSIRARIHRAPLERAKPLDKAA